MLLMNHAYPISTSRQRPINCAVGFADAISTMLTGGLGFQLDSIHPMSWLQVWQQADEPVVLKTALVGVVTVPLNLAPFTSAAKGEPVLLANGQSSSSICCNLLTLLSCCAAAQWLCHKAAWHLQVTYAAFGKLGLFTPV